MIGRLCLHSVDLHHDSMIHMMIEIAHEWTLCSGSIQSVYEHVAWMYLPHRSSDMPTCLFNQVLDHEHVRQPGCAHPGKDIGWYLEV